MDEPTELNASDIDRCFENMTKQEPKPICCSWCGLFKATREVGPNYICYGCEKEERKCGRPLVFCAPVREAFWRIGNE